MDRLDNIRRNAQHDEDPCAGCPAHEVAEGELVNPGGRARLRHRGTAAPDRMGGNTTRGPSTTRSGPADSGGGEGRPVHQSTPLEDGPPPLRRLGRGLDQVSAKRDDQRGIPARDTDDAFRHCRTYLDRAIAQIDPQAVVTLGKGATIRMLETLGVPATQAQQVRVTKEYGASDFDTPYPVVISLHWAQRTVAEDEWVPAVQAAIAEVVNAA